MTSMSAVSMTAAGSRAGRPPVRAPAALPTDIDQRLAEAAPAEMRGGGGGGGPESAADRAHRLRMEDLREASDGLSQQQALALVNNIRNAGRNADPEDPCERVMAMYDTLMGQLGTPDEDEREEVMQRCQRDPGPAAACLKPEEERTPSERRFCNRVFEDDPLAEPEDDPAEVAA
ncbi:MAG: hypothetical protein AAGF12_23955, partial [Myxococcota bacterium]